MKTHVDLNLRLLLCNHKVPCGLWEGNVRFDQNTNSVIDSNKAITVSSIVSLPAV